MRIYTSRRRDRLGWTAVIAGCAGIYLVLALGFHWFLQPIVKNSEAAAAATPPPFAIDPARRLLADPGRRPAAPAPSLVPPRRDVAQRPSPEGKPPSSSDAKPAPARAGELARIAIPEQDAVTPPKKEPKKKVARKAHDRPVRQAADPRNPWSFASSPGYSSYRPWF